MSIRAWLAKRRIKAVFKQAEKAVAADPATPPGEAGDGIRIFVHGLNRLTERAPDFSTVPGVLIKPVAEAGFRGDLVSCTPPTNKNNPDNTQEKEDTKAILFLHGGGYIWGSARHFHDTAIRLSRLTGVPVLIPTYSLTPTHIYPTQLHEARAAHDFLLDQGISAAAIALVGDSAGGNLAFALAQQLAADREAPIAAAMVLFSPWLDMTAQAHSVSVNAPHDIMLSPSGLDTAARLFVGERALKDPAVSPLFGEMAGLPPTHIQVSSRELLLDDATRAAERIEAAGGAADLVVWRGLWHDFQQSAAVVPEARKALALAAAFMQKAWDRPTKNPAKNPTKP